MADFDPYYEWLGIAPEEQPANHYRLLGLRLFEANPSVIQNAADRQMSHLRTFQSGRRGPDSQRLLNEVAAAKLCLLKPENKAAYDKELRAKQPADAAKPAPPQPAQRPPQSAQQPLARATPLARAAPLRPQPAPPAAVPDAAAFADPLEAVAELSHSRSARRRKRGKTGQQSFLVYGIVGALLVAGVAGAALMLNSGEEPRNAAVKSAASSRPKPSMSQSVAARAGDKPQPAPPSAVEPTTIPPGRAKAGDDDSTKGHGALADGADSDDGRWVDLLAWAEEFAKLGGWKLRGVDWDDMLEQPATHNGIAIKPKDLQYYPLPALLEGDYDLETEFTRREGNDGVTVFFPVGMHNVQIELSIHGGDRAGLAWVDGKSLSDSPVYRSPSPIRNGDRHRLSIHVRHESDEAAINVDLDGAKDYLTWRGDSARLENRDGYWKPTMTRHVWLGSTKNLVTFQKVRARAVSGEIRRDYRTTDERTEDLRNGFVRLVDLPFESPTVGWGRFCVNQIPPERAAGDVEALWPLVGPACRLCEDFYGAHAPSRLKCPIPAGARSFSVSAYNAMSRTAKFLIYVDGKLVRRTEKTPLASFLIPLAKGDALLELVADEAGDSTWDHVYWLNPRFSETPPGNVAAPLSEPAESGLRFTVSQAVSQYGGSDRGEVIAADSTPPLEPADVVPCDEFLFAYGDSSVSYEVPSGMKRFTAVGYCVRTNLVRYEIWSAGKMIYQSPIGGIMPIDVSLPPGAKSMELRTLGAEAGRPEVTMWCYPQFRRDAAGASEPAAPMVPLATASVAPGAKIETADSMSAKAADQAPVAASVVEKAAVAKKTGGGKKGVAEQADAGEWIDLLAWAEEFGALGGWKPRGIDWEEYIENSPSSKGITLRPVEGARYPLPAIIDGEYDLELEFVRRQGGESIAIFFPVGIHNLHFEISMPNGRAGLAYIDGANAWNTPINSERSVSNNERHRALIKVRREGEEALINIDLDDTQDFLIWRGPEWQLASHEYDGWKLSTTRRPWIGSWKSSVTFDQIRIRLVSGTIDRDFRSEADRADERRHGLVRAVDLPANSPTVGYAKFCVGQIPLARGGGEEETIWPLVSPTCTPCSDYYYAHAPSKLKCPIPKGAKTFSVAAYNVCSRRAKYLIYVDGKIVEQSGITPIAFFNAPLPPGAALLELVADPAGANNSDQVYWCNPRFFAALPEKITPAMRKARSSTLRFTIADHRVGAGEFAHNKTDGGSVPPMDPAEAVPCDEFLLAHVDSSVSYQAPAGMTRFSAVGYCSKTDRVRYEVWADAERIYESPVCGLAPMSVRLPAGTKTVELRTKNAGANGGQWTMWCYPRFHAK